MQKKQYKIIIGIFMSFLIAVLMGRIVFLANTPSINPSFISSLANLPVNLLNLPKKLLIAISTRNINNENSNSLTNKNLFRDPATVNLPPNTIFKSISKGVYAADDEAKGVKYIKIDGNVKLELKTLKVTFSDGTVKEITAWVQVSK